MDLELRRYEEQELRTFGKLYIDGELICDTLEDTDRHLEDLLPDLEKVKQTKVYAKTAIPRGKYKVENYFWKKYNNWYPHILNVPGFTGILIHGGMTEDHTSGCVLLGTRNGDILTRSSVAMEKIRKCFKESKNGEIRIC